MNSQMTNGSPARSIALSDGQGVLRDAIIVVLSAAVARLANYVDGGLSVEVQMAIVTLSFAGMKACYKWLTDTRRVSGI